MARRDDSLLQRRRRPGLAGGPRRLCLEPQRRPHPFRAQLAGVGATRDQALLAQSLRRSRTRDRGIRRAGDRGAPAHRRELPALQQLFERACRRPRAGSCSRARARGTRLRADERPWDLERRRALPPGSGLDVALRPARAGRHQRRCGALRRPHELCEPRLVFRVYADPVAGEPLGRAPGRRDRRAPVRAARSAADASLSRRSDTV